jgi:hypothetical protein
MLAQNGAQTVGCLKVRICLMKITNSSQIKIIFIATAVAAAAGTAQCRGA